MKALSVCALFLWVGLAHGAPAGVCPDGRIAINEAGPAAFQTLKGIGAKKAARIVAERKSAPFASVEAMTRVKGIGPATVAKLRPQLVLKCGDAPAPAIQAALAKPAAAACAKPIDINTASAAELTTLKGIGAKKAAAIIAQREASKGFQTVDGLTAVKGIGPATVNKLRDCLTVK